MIFRTRIRAFTLIELLVVITIIGILVGITLGTVGYAQKKAANSRAQAEVTAIGTALERYKTEYGDYPSISSISITGSGVTARYATSPSGYVGTSPTLGNGTMTGGAGARLLFASLMGRKDYRAVPTLPVFLELRESQISGNGTSKTDAYIIDPYGYAYGYYYKADGNATGSGNAYAKSLGNEVTPDIWSTGGQSGGTMNNMTISDPVFGKWIVNWAAQ